MMEFAGTNRMSVAPLMEYFKPLIDWLELQVPEEERGWSEECTHVTEGDVVQTFLEQYEKDASKQNYKLKTADWTFNTNITQANAELKVLGSLLHIPYS